MKQTQDVFSQDQLNSILAMVQLMNQNDPLRQLELEEKQRTKAEREELERVQKEARKQNAETMEAKRKEKLMEQEACNHLKENGRTQIVGQRDHSNNTHFFCQRCQKEWVNMQTSDNPKGLPTFLHPDPIWVGGPQL